MWYIYICTYTYICIYIHIYNKAGKIYIKVQLAPGRWVRNDFCFLSFPWVLFSFSHSKYILQRASQMAQIVKNLPTMQKTQVWSLGWENPLKKRMATQSSILAWRIPTDWGTWWVTIHGVTKSRTWLRELTCPHHISQNWGKALYICVLKLNIYVGGCLLTLFPHVVCPAPVHLARESHIIFLHSPLRWYPMSGSCRAHGRAEKDPQKISAPWIFCPTWCQQGERVESC